KRDYYDPTMDVVEAGTQQFRTLDQIWSTILEFHDFENVEEYKPEDRRWFVLELLAAEKTLLILDNFETVASSAQKEIVRFFGIEAKQYLRSMPDALTVILTSRKLIPSGFHQFMLKGLDKRESKALMLRLEELYQRSGQAMPSDAQRSEIVRVTSGIPLIIKH